MKTVLQLFFVLFYVTSSYAVTKIRTVDLLQKLESAGDAPAMRAEHPTDFDHLPRYRDAQKVINDFPGHPVWRISLALTEVEAFLCHDSGRQLAFTLPPSHSRAPPRFS